MIVDDEEEMSYRQPLNIRQTADSYKNFINSVRTVDKLYNKSPANAATKQIDPSSAAVH